MHAFQKALAAAAGLAGATMLGSRYFYELAIPRRSKLTIHGRGQSPEQKAAQRKRMEGFERWMAEQISGRRPSTVFVCTRNTSRRTSRRTG